jgi:hypothetical protein
MLQDLLNFPEQVLPLRRPKARWSPKEDGVLLQAIQDQGPRCWNSIAQLLTGRTGKQCRERYLTKLSPDFSSDSWTKEEDAILIHLQNTHGNQWSRFRGALPRRSTLSIKNRWASLKRQDLRDEKEATHEASESRLQRVEQIVVERPPQDVVVAVPTEEIVVERPTEDVVVPVPPEEIVVEAPPEDIGVEESLN